MCQILLPKSRELRKIKSNLYYHRHSSANATSHRKHLNYNKRRARFINKQLKKFKQLDADQHVNFSRTAGQLCSKLEEKLETYKQLINKSASTQ